MEVIDNPSESSNSELVLAMDVIQSDFTNLKDKLIKITYQLDTLEETYNKLLTEYNKRNGFNKETK
jgi:site-specific DNA-adenine methylase